MGEERIPENATVVSEGNDQHTFPLIVLCLENRRVKKIAKGHYTFLENTFAKSIETVVT